MVIPMLIRSHEVDFGEMVILLECERVLGNSKFRLEFNGCSDYEPC